jgi:hypothetical protein
MTKNTEHWVHGLVAAFIGGGSSAVTGGITVSGLAPGQFNFGAQLGAMGKLMFALFVVNGGLSAFAYLKQSPLPTESVEVVEMKTTTVSVTPTEGK